MCLDRCEHGDRDRARGRIAFLRRDVHAELAGLPDAGQLGQVEPVARQEKQ